MVEPREAWERLSIWWDEQIGEGDPFHTHLIYPAIERFLPLAPGDRLLDLACGNGSVARRFARRGVRVTAVDFAEGFLKIARSKSRGIDDIDFQVADLTRTEDLARLQARSFDAALCSMALHTLETLDPLLSALPRLLVPGGRFACSIVHPYFNSTPQMSIVTEDEFSGESIVSTRSVRVFDYLTATGHLARGKQDQPVPHHNYHRPLGELLGRCFAAGFVLDGYHEPSGVLLPPEVTSMWKTLPAIPPVLILSFHLDAR